MTAESVYRSALTLLGEHPDSTHLTETALSALSLIVLELEPLYAAYDAAYGQAHTPASAVNCLCDPLTMPAVFFPTLVYALTASLCRSYNAEYAAVLEEKYRSHCQSLWAILPAAVHPVRDSYSE